jgi:predicted nucleotidyltransferase
MVPDQFGLKADDIKKIQSVLSEFSLIKSALLYGSRAKGSYKHGSDIDLTLKTEGELPRGFLLDVMNAIDGLDLAYSFDISLLHQIDNDNLLEHINRVGVEFYNAKRV